VGAVLRRARVRGRRQHGHRVRVQQPLPGLNQLAAAPEPLLACLAGALGNVGAPNVKGFNQSLVVLAGEHAEILRASGWRRADVQRFLLEHTRYRVADLKRAARLPGAVEPADETTWRYVFE